MISVNIATIKVFIGTARPALEKVGRHVVRVGDREAFLVLELGHYGVVA